MSWHTRESASRRSQLCIALCALRQRRDVGVAGGRATQFTRPRTSARHPDASSMTLTSATIWSAGDRRGGGRRRYPNRLLEWVVFNSPRAAARRPVLQPRFRAGAEEAPYGLRGKGRDMDLADECAPWRPTRGAYPPDRSRQRAGTSPMARPGLEPGDTTMVRQHSYHDAPRTRPGLHRGRSRSERAPR
jgi:hypothetical protein